MSHTSFMAALDSVPWGGIWGSCWGLSLYFPKFAQFVLNFAAQFCTPRCSCWSWPRPQNEGPDELGMLMLVNLIYGDELKIVLYQGVWALNPLPTPLVWIHWYWSDTCSISLNLGGFSAEPPCLFQSMTRGSCLPISVIRRLHLFLFIYWSIDLSANPLIYLGTVGRFGYLIKRTSQPVRLLFCWVPIMQIEVNSL